MATTRITTGEPNLMPALGPLTGPQRGRILELLAEADARLGAVAETLAAEGEQQWSFAGVVLTIAESGQTSIDAQVAETTGKIAFSAQLRPGNFFPSEEGMWKPGEAPLKMSTDAWDVDGNVAIRYRKRVSGRPFVITDQVVELPERHFEDPLAAVEAFAAVCGELAELAASREATVDAWRPPEEDATADASAAAPSI